MVFIDHGCYGDGLNGALDIFNGLCIWPCNYKRSTLLNARYCNEIAKLMKYASEVICLLRSVPLDLKLCTYPSVIVVTQSSAVFAMDISRRVRWECFVLF